MSTVLLTGATSGLGFEAARQLAERASTGDRILLAARSLAKARAARDTLVDQTGISRDTVGILAFDLTDPTTIRSALDRLDETIDAVVLNAGGLAGTDHAGQPRITATGQTELFAMNVGGHAVLVEELHARSRLAPGATVMFVGSEVVRGVPSLNVPTPRLPAGHGDVEATVHAIMTGAHAGAGYDLHTDYALVKLLGTAWATHLHETLGHRYRILTVSPGATNSALGTWSLSGFLQALWNRISLPWLSQTSPAHTVETGAARYLEVLQSDRFEGGRFYASPGDRVTGALVEQHTSLQPLLAIPAFIDAVGRMLAVPTATVAPTALAA